MAQPLLDIHVTRKTFGATEVLNEVQLHLHSREIVSLLGRVAAARAPCYGSSPGWIATSKALCSARPAKSPLCFKSHG